MYEGLSTGKDIQKDAEKVETYIEIESSTDRKKERNIQVGKREIERDRDSLGGEGRLTKTLINSILQEM